MFAAYNRDFVARGEGFSLLILESKDARADAATFSAAGFAASEDLRFERDARRPDGSSVKVGFSLAFAEDKAVHDIHFASCQQHYPENFWNPAFQEHSNSVAGVVGVVVVANQPEQHQKFFEVFADAPAVARPGGFAIATPRNDRSGKSRRFLAAFRGQATGYDSRRPACGPSLCRYSAEPSASGAGTRRHGGALCRK
jgi:hypothetical protein